MKILKFIKIIDILNFGEEIIDQIPLGHYFFANGLLSGHYFLLKFVSNWVFIIPTKVNIVFFYCGYPALEAFVNPYSRLRGFDHGKKR